LWNKIFNDKNLLAVNNPDGGKSLPGHKAAGRIKITKTPPAVEHPGGGL